MTTHELARKLLEKEDVDVMVVYNLRHSGTGFEPLFEAPILDIIDLGPDFHQRMFHSYGIRVRVTPMVESPFKGEGEPLFIKAPRNSIEKMVAADLTK